MVTFRYLVRDGLVYLLGQKWFGLGIRLEMVQLDIRLEIIQFRYQVRDGSGLVQVYQVRDGLGVVQVYKVRDGLGLVQVYQVRD